LIRKNEMHLEVNYWYTEKAKENSATVEAVYSDVANEYIVEKHTITNSDAFEFRLAIKRTDKETIRSWRILQDIKNSIVGDDAVAIEVYPRESEVTDTANMYHLWVFKDGLAPRVSLIAS
jgi:hypothetical protein